MWDVFNLKSQIGLERVEEREGEEGRKGQRGRGEGEQKGDKGRVTAGRVFRGAGGGAMRTPSDFTGLVA